MDEDGGRPGQVPGGQHPRIQRQRPVRRHQAHAGGRVRPHTRARRDHRAEAVRQRPRLSQPEGRGRQGARGDLEIHPVPRLGLRPENGIEVIATGKISAYGDRSEYQLVIDRLEYAGAGALLARIEMLRQRLAAEGLFDAAAKRALPRAAGQDRRDHLGQRRRAARHHDHHRPPLSAPDPALAGAGAGRGGSRAHRRRHRRDGPAAGARHRPAGRADRGARRRLAWKT